MPNQVQLSLMRDKKETQLDGIQESIKHAEEMRGLYQATFKTTLENYKEWLKANKMEGIKY